MSEFKLVSGMQVVQRNQHQKGSNREFQVSTFCESEGWIEIHCSAEQLDYIKEIEINKILDKEKI